MKRIKGIIVTTLVLCIGIIGYSIYNNSLNINEENILESNKETSMNNLAIMLQNDEGIYEQKDMDTWPTEGYVFNDTLSSCENGGHLEWDGESVVLTANGSDKCYVYFDKYEPLKIISADVESMGYNSVRLNSVSLNKDLQVSKYIVTIIDPDNYKGIFTFTNLNQTITNDSVSYDYENGCIGFDRYSITNDRTYTYEIYVITNDGITSEKYDGIVRMTKYGNPCKS